MSVPTAIAQNAPNIWSIQLHGGLFAPIDVGGTNPTIGMRYSKHYSSHVQGGLLTGWTLRSKSLEAPVDGLRSGASYVEIARVYENLVPVMGFMQVDLTEKTWLLPFVGIGGGYEWLIIALTGNKTGLKSKAAYGNFAWETYAGVGMRLTSKVRVNGELFYNGGSLERSVLDSSGHPFQEAVDVNGVGARVGLYLEFE